MAGAGRKLLSLFDFPGGAAFAILTLATPAALLGQRRGDRRSDASRVISACTLAWAVIYLALWAKFAVPWQRYTIPLATALLVAGVLGVDRLASAAVRADLLARRAVKVAVAVAASAVLVPPACFSGLISFRFSADASHPLFRLTAALREESHRQVFINEWWSWNRPLLDILSRDRFTVRFVPSLDVACANARESDIVVDLVFEPLAGNCPKGRLTRFFQSSNLGPAGYPYPADHTSPYSGSAPDRVDYHYLFQDVTASRFSSGGLP
jgi:hypothetical protein